MSSLSLQKGGGKMKQSEAAQFLPLIKAWSEGKTLQLKGTEGGWIDINNSEVNFTYPPSEWRIKPEPRECYIPEDVFAAYCSAGTGVRFNLIRVREVIE
jgi:hypothetical protein